MSYNKINQSHSSSYDELLFLSNEKVPKVKIPCSYSNEGDLYWLEDSPYVTFKSLFWVGRNEKSSKSGEGLQNKRCSSMAESSSPLILFPGSAKIPKCSYILIVWS